MKIDANLYRAALEEYRQWNEAELKARLRNAPYRDPDAGLREFDDLWELARALGVTQSHSQRQRKLEALERYYERVKRLEAWRQSRG
jgi:hypothetical protein